MPFFYRAVMESKILDIIRDRCSVRDYSGRDVEEEKLDLILESARLAPSASNSQPWHFYIVRDKKKIEQLSGRMPIGSKLVINGFIGNAPVVIVATAGPIDIIHRALSYIVNKKWYFLDIGIALEHMVLTAWDLGIGSCWIGWFDEKRIKKLLSIPKDREVVAMITLGYPSSGFVKPSKSRKSLEQIVTEI